MKKFNGILAVALIALCGCRIVATDLTGRQCNPEGDCVDGYTCDQETNLCVQTQDSCEDPGRIISCSLDPSDPTIDCANDSCRVCNDTGWSDCVFNPCLESNPCGDNGTCEPSDGSCSCEVGYAGLACDTCDTGFHPVGDDCMSDDTCAVNDPTSASCNEHGTCSTPAGVVLCECSAEYAGPTCADCAAGHHIEGNLCVIDQNCNPDGPSSASCSGHGTCDDSTLVIQCACDTGYAGATCTQCDTGYHLSGDGVTCTDDPCDPNVCTSPNKTVCLESGGVAFCSCDTGYHLDGSNCVLDDTCNGNASCNFNGTCDDSSGTIVCSCSTGYAGITCAQCDTGYHLGGDGVTCTQDVCDPNPCTDPNKGICTDAGGPTCSCDPGYHLEGSNCVLDQTCVANSCNLNGTCDDSSGTIVCSCDTGYSGVTCDTCDTGYTGYPSCIVDQCIGQTCNGNGTCDPSDGSCTCDGNQDPNNDCGSCLTGLIEYPICRDDPCLPDPCNGRGACDNSGPTAVCTCLAGWSGASCDIEPFSITLETSAALNADNPTLNDGPSDCRPLFFRVEAVGRDISFGLLAVGVSCNLSGRVVDGLNQGHLYRHNGSNYAILTLEGSGGVSEVAIYSVNAAGDEVTFVFTTEEVILQGETRNYRFSPVMENLVQDEICTFTVLGAGDSAGSGTILSLLSSADMCVDPLDLAFSDFSDAAHFTDGSTYVTVDPGTCQVQDAGTQDWHTGATQMISASITLVVP